MKMTEILNLKDLDKAEQIDLVIAMQTLSGEIARRGLDVSKTCVLRSIQENLSFLNLVLADY